MIWKKRLLCYGHNAEHIENWKTKQRKQNSVIHVYNIKITDIKRATLHETTSVEDVFLPALFGEGWEHLDSCWGRGVVIFGTGNVLNGGLLPRWKISCRNLHMIWKLYLSIFDAYNQRRRFKIIGMTGLLAAFKRLCISGRRFSPPEPKICLRLKAKLLVVTFRGQNLWTIVL